MTNHNIYSKNCPNSQLGYYLAGLIEGDGNIWTPKSYNAIGRKYSPQITFTFHVKEIPFFSKLKDIFATGSLSKENSNNSAKYRIAQKDKLIDFINLVNGKFRTAKIKDLHRAIDYVNLIHKTDIKKLPLDESNIDSNAWLAGFTDADGHFQISLEGKYKSDNYKRGRIKCIFSIKQKMFDKRLGESFIGIISKIAEHFECNLLFQADNELTFFAQANSKHHITTKYFNKYPLITSKYLNYISFVQGINYLGKRLTDQDIIEIRKIKNSMNNKRIFYDWSHLNNFKTAVS